MAKKADTPCACGCGRMLWSGPRSLPAEQRLSRECRKRLGVAPVPAAPPAVEPAERPGEPSEGFGPRGARLWQEMAAQRVKMSPAEIVLLEEACRAADRLDRLDQFLAGHGEVWLRFRRNDDGTVVRVTVDRALAEVRQQADSLRGIVADLLKKTAAAPETSEEEKGGSLLDELARRRQNRQQDAASS